MVLSVILYYTAWHIYSNTYIQDIKIAYAVVVYIDQKDIPLNPLGVRQQRAIARTRECI